MSLCWAVAGLSKGREGGRGGKNKVGKYLDVHTPQKDRVLLLNGLGNEWEG